MKKIFFLFVIFLGILQLSPVSGWAQENQENSATPEDQEIEKALDALSGGPQKKLPEAIVRKSEEQAQRQLQVKEAAGQPSASPQSQPSVSPSGPSSIRQITIQGNKIVSTNTIMSKIQIRPGTPFGQETINADLKRLYASGFFEDIRVELEEVADGYNLIFIVDEKPIIHEIRLSGHSAFKEDKLRKEIPLLEGQILDRQQIKQGVEKIRQLYRDKGFRFVDVNANVDVNQSSKEAIVDIQIFEGEKYKIKQIDFTGLSAFKEKQLRKMMKTKEKGWVFRPGVFDSEKFQKDLERLQLFYQQEGYLDARLEPDFQYDKESREIHILIKIDEGRHYVTGVITISGNKLFPESEIWEALEMLPGLTYSQYYLSKDVEGVRDYYYRQGYMDARVIPDVQLNRDNGKVDVAYKIEEGDLYFVEKVVVRGNTKTKDMVVRRELRIRPGDRFDGGQIDKSKERLQNLGFFEEITYDTEPTETSNRKDLVFRVKEKRTGELSFGGGVSSVDRLVGFAQISQRNFDAFNFPRFTGAGQSLSLSARIGSISQNFDLSFVEPYLLNKPVALGLDGFSVRHDNHNVDFAEERRGGSATLSRTFKDVWKVGGGYTLERVSLDDISSDAPQTVLNFSGVNWLSRLRSFTSHDTRDNVFNPTRGHLASFNADLIGSFLGGDQDFYTLQAGYTQYWSLFKKHVFEWRLRLGTSQEFGDSDEVPIFDRFYAGGLGSVRGYNYRRVGPIEAGDAIGGESLFISNLEYTFPIPRLEAFKGAFFVDAGHVNEESYKLSFSEIALSVGPGIKVQTPIGPVAFYYGLPIANRDTEDRHGKFEFSLSRGF
ncbi:MAG: outer membrane protein assembly factor BamA [Omnitrophica bacterium GWA2_52_8]|nr:MAG: outer membrane protein assembly factor BamA [Omnitrophica bacterium GWA2_52_8]